MFGTLRKFSRRRSIEEYKEEKTEDCEEKRKKEIERLLLLEDDLTEFVQRQISNRVVANVQISLIESVFSLIKAQLRQQEVLYNKRLGNDEKVPLKGSIQNSVNSLISNVLIHISNQQNTKTASFLNCSPAPKGNNEIGEFDEDSSTGNPFDQMQSASPLRMPVKWSGKKTKSGQILIDLNSLEVGKTLQMEKEPFKEFGW